MKIPEAFQSIRTLNGDTHRQDKSAMKIKNNKHLNVLTLFLLVCITGQGATVGFEGIRGAIPVEGMVISNQFQPFFGVHFSGLRSNDVPVIARRGFPDVAFGANAGEDEIDPTDPRFNEIGDFFLTVQRPSGYPWGLTLLFDAPISNITFYALDLDFREVITADAFALHNDTNALITRVYASSSGDGPQPADRGDGNTTLVTVTAANQSELFSKLTISLTRNSVNGGNIGFDRFVYDYTPTNPGPSTLSLQMYPGLEIHGVAGWAYRIDYADKLDITPGQTNWNPLTNLFLPTSSYLFFDARSPGGSQRFYRAVTGP